ncbi:MAG: hypothetical protein WCS85_01465 [Candidatus Peribacteraceae bacterium]|jgi:hypothetical protein
MTIAQFLEALQSFTHLPIDEIDHVRLVGSALDDDGRERMIVQLHETNKAFVDAAKEGEQSVQNLETLNRDMAQKVNTTERNEKEGKQQEHDATSAEERLSEASSSLLP